MYLICSVWWGLSSGYLWRVFVPGNIIRLEPGNINQKFSLDVSPDKLIHHSKGTFGLTTNTFCQLWQNAFLSPKYISRWGTVVASLYLVPVSDWLSDRLIGSPTIGWEKMVLYLLHWLTLMCQHLQDQFKKVTGASTASVRHSAYFTLAKWLRGIKMRDCSRALSGGKHYPGCHNCYLP